MASKGTYENLLLFEHPFTRVPYENYRKVFRTSQKHVERELGAVQAGIVELTKRDMDETEREKAIEGLLARVENLKRKLTDLHESSGQPTIQVIRERLLHLAPIENTDAIVPDEWDKWADTRLDRWIVDWCLRNGKEKTARKIAQERNIETLVDLELFADIRRIESALSSHSCTEALAWCSENKSTLRKTKNYLEFELRFQEYIELCRRRQHQDAIAYSKKYLVGWHETHMDRIQQGSGLLVHSPTTPCARYKRLYDDSRWLTLVKSFRHSVYNLNSLPTEPLLNLSLYAGLAALKLPVCFHQSSKNVDCPVCDGAAHESHSTSASLAGAGAGGSGVGLGLGLGKLAMEVPHSHHANSTIVCFITGKIMDEDNMPLAFPDGHVYSKEALEAMAAKNDGMVTCPRTGATCEFSALRRVFIS